MQGNVSDYLIRSVEERDIPNIRGALFGIIDKNPQNIDTMELSNALDYVRKTISDQQLFEENDTGFDDPDSANDYYYVLSSLKQNFSKEKLQRLISLGGRKPQSTHCQELTTRQYTTNDTNQHREHKSNNNNGYRDASARQSMKPDSGYLKREENNRPFEVSAIMIAGVVVLVVIIGIVVLLKKL